jgi:hypothetical protein
MRGVEELLRARFEQMNGVVPADSRAVLAKVRTKRRRRQATIAGMATFAVLTAGIIGADLPRAGHDGASSPQTQPPADDGSTARIDGVGFTSPTTGYALAATCAKGATAECDWVLAATDDGGDTWESRSLPPDWLTNQPDRFRIPRFLVLGPQTLALFTPMWDGWWLSQDGGRSWRSPAPLPSATMTSIPAGASVLPGARGTLQVLAPDGTGGVVMVDAAGAVPTSGTRPDLGTASVTASDGSIWVPCATSSEPDQDACVLVSRDIGRTWRSIRPGKQRRAATTTVSISTLNGRDILVEISSAGSYDTTQTVEVYRSRDSGVTWSAVKLPRYGVDGGLVVGVMGVELLADGTMLAAVDGKLYRTTRGSNAFALVRGAPANVTSLAWSGSQLLITTFPAHRPVTEQVLLYRSANGSTWRPIPLD